VHRIDLTLQMRGESDQVGRQHDELSEATDPAFPLDPGTFGSESFSLSGTQKASEADGWCEGSLR